MEFLSKDILSYIFAFLMGLSMLIYAILDGYDLGVGMLTKFVSDKEKDKMIAAIGPFWDANETWLVLGVGILLVAFPDAHGVILTNLYLPVSLMLIGLIFRGVAFDFRAKVKTEKKEFWNKAFFFGSLLATLSQGYMLGSYILGFKTGLAETLFAILIAFILVGGYCLVGSCWLIYKTEKNLQQKAISWAQDSFKITILGIILISIFTPLTSGRIFAKWFVFPDIIFLSAVPLLTLLAIIYLYKIIYSAELKADKKSIMPFLTTVLIFILCFFGLAYSFFPYIVPDQLLIVDATIESRESMLIMFFGAVLVLPILLGYTAFVYQVFKGKATELSYK